MPQAPSLSKKMLPLRHEFLQARVLELNLKQWWLAEQVGVDRKTVTRWLNGQVQQIQPENARALAQVLGCLVTDLCNAGAELELATSEDQKNAAQHLQTNSSLVDKLGPMGEWPLIESLLKATLVPELPLATLGDLYAQLTVASWRQNKMSQAEAYNEQTLSIADRCHDTFLGLPGSWLHKLFKQPQNCT